MSGLDKNRLRNKTVSFRMSPNEIQQLEARIKVCGMPKGEYFIKSLLHQEMNIVVGKYQSDRLSLELQRLRTQIQGLENAANGEQFFPLLLECKALLVELQAVNGFRQNEE